MSVVHCISHEVSIEEHLNSLLYIIYGSCHPTLNARAEI